jgi:hypothetical protein
MRRYEANLALQLGGVMVAGLYGWPLFVFCDSKLFLFRTIASKALLISLER